MRDKKTAIAVVLLIFFIFIYAYSIYKYNESIFWLIPGVISGTAWVVVLTYLGER